MEGRQRLGLRRRLVDELGEVGFELDEAVAADEALLDEIVYAMRPPVHERRIPSFGALVGRHLEHDWEEATGLHIVRSGQWTRSTDSARRYADGLSTWLGRGTDGLNEWIVLDRAASSERDLVIMADALGGRIVQRHPSGLVRIVTEVGVLRWNGLLWHREPPVKSWMPVLSPLFGSDELAVLRSMLAFAVHDLGSLGIGALLVHGWRGVGVIEERMPLPPPLQVVVPWDLAALRHILAQIDGAAVFDPSGTLVHIGARLAPSTAADEEVEGYGGMRHTSARRFTFDDPHVVAIVVSDDGPVTMFSGGEIVARSG